MKKRINLRLILIAGIAVIVTMVCMPGIYYKLLQGQVRKDLQVNAIPAGYLDCKGWDGTF